MLKTWTVKNDELPYRIQIDKLSGAATSPAEAAMAALSAGGKIPAGCRDGKQAAWHILWNFETCWQWRQLIHILNKNTFDSFEKHKKDCPVCHGKGATTDHHDPCSECGGSGKVE